MNFSISVELVSAGCAPLSTMSGESRLRLETLQDTLTAQTLNLIVRVVSCANVA